MAVHQTERHHVEYKAGKNRVIVEFDPVTGNGSIVMRLAPQDGTEKVHEFTFTNDLETVHDLGEALRRAAEKAGYKPKR